MLKRSYVQSARVVDGTSANTHQTGAGKEVWLWGSLQGGEELAISARLLLRAWTLSVFWILL